jgi:hypothetical protein
LQSVTLGDIVSRGRHRRVVPVTTVDVGTQAPGTIAESTRFNSVVHAGQVLLRLTGRSCRLNLDEARARPGKARGSPVAHPGRRRGVEPQRAEALAVKI